MGDRVAVMQTGGTLAQFATPAELLTWPNSDFVARFVGADRGLKRLALVTVADAALEQAATIYENQVLGSPDDGVPMAGAKYRLLLDGQDHPIGWLNTLRMAAGERASRGAAEPSSPLLNFNTTLRDALSQLLGLAVQTGVVVDDSGRYVGIITVQSIAATLRAAIEEPREEVVAAS
jgi:osmoprotectant transport system ATP-binding protein